MTYAASPYPAILYKATNLVNGKIYIGITTKTITKRSKVHRDAASRGRGAVIGAALRKYGKENIKFEMLIACPSWEYAKEMERRCIAAFKPEYNLTEGGDGVVGYKHTENAKAIISNANKGKRHNLGKTHSLESRAKMSAIKKAYWDSVPHSRKPYIPKNGPRRGKPVACKGMVYESVCHAARENGLGREELRSALERKTNTGVIGGLRFSYVVWLVDKEP